MNKLQSGILYSLTGLACIPNTTQLQAAKKTKQKPLNIVYIMTDDHTRQMMSCYDNRYVETPHLDRIANGGVRFTHSYVANSISGPSRACMLTGKHSHANGFYDNSSCSFDSAQQTMPKLLRKAGYQTAMIGKWHLESIPSGFDFWEILPGQGDYYNPIFIQMDKKRVQKKGYVTNIITDMTTNWLDHRDKEKPFCVFVHHKAVHRNWMPDTAHLHLYEDKQFPIPSNFYDNYEDRQAAATQQMSIDKDMDLIYDLKMLMDNKNTPYRRYYEGIIKRMNTDERAAWDRVYNPIITDFYSRDLKGKELAEWKYQRYMRDYAKTLKSLDDNVGRLLDYLEKNDLMDNTLIVYTSDQGFYMGEHGWFDKRFMYEESMSTPLVMHLPKGYKKRGDIPQLVQNIDYAPTFLEMAGIQVPQDMHGTSLVPLLKGKTPKTWRNSLYYQFYEYPGEHAVKRHYGVRTNRYKLIHFYNNIDQWELYDLQEDPTEMTNLYNQPQYKELIAELKAEILRLQVQYDSPTRFSTSRDRENK